MGRAAAEGAELAIFPELCLPGYPAEDLYLKRHFVEANRAAVDGARPRQRRDDRRWSASPSRSPTAATIATPTTRLPSSAGGEVRAVYRKNRLPNYAVFDEQRYFVPGDRADDDRGRRRHGRPDRLRGRLGGGPAGVDRGGGGGRADRQPVGLALPPRQGPRARSDVRRPRPRLRRPPRLLQPRRRPGRAGLRRPELRRRPERRGDRPRRPVRGGAADLRDPAERPGPTRRASAPTSPRSTRRSSSACATTSPRTAFATSASRSRAGSTRLSSRCSPPTRSGPRTSAAWSCPRPIPATRPRRTPGLSPPTSASSRSRSRSRRRWRPTRTALAPSFAVDEEAAPRSLPHDPARPSEPDLAAENIQARIRGNVMMALSNKHGWLVLTTGNKSEMSVGYATLYGDMAGGFAAIKDVPKTLVYELVRYRNESAGRGAGPCLGARAGALGRAAPRPARQRLAAALRAARPRARGLRRARPGTRGDGRGGDARRTWSTRWCGWSTAPSTSAARRRRESASRQRRSAGTGDCRSLTASGDRPDGDRHLRQGAEPVVGVEDFGVPDPGGAAAVAGPGLDFGVAAR